MYNYIKQFRNMFSSNAFLFRTAVFAAIMVLSALPAYSQTPDGVSGATSMLQSSKEKRSTDKDKIKAPKGYELVWHDEFNDPESPDGRPVLPDAKSWWYEEGKHGWGNNELQNYIPGFKDGDTLAYVSNGTLKIKQIRTSSGEVRSIRMNTKAHWTYGYFEARLKLPSGKGTWPAFWMMPHKASRWPDCGEIDIMEEVGYDPHHVLSSIHCAKYHGGNSKSGGLEVRDCQTAFHVYACEWTPEYIKFFVDGKKIHVYKNDGNGRDTWPFDAPFYIKLNNAFGGNWGGKEGVDYSCLPTLYEIDYVRVFQKK